MNKDQIKPMLFGAALVLAGVAGGRLFDAAIPAAYAQAGRDCQVATVNFNTAPAKIQQLAQQGYEFKGQVMTHIASGSFQTDIVACR